MESKTKNRKTREQIEQLAARAFNGIGLAAGEEAIRELKEGWFNAAYTVRLAGGREVILKIAPPQDAEVMTYEKNLMETEVTAMRLARTNPAIPVPEIYFYDPTRDLCDAGYFFMEKLAGDNLDHVKASLPPEMQAEIEFRIGEIIREINGFTGDYFGYPGNSDLRSETWRAAFMKIMDSVLEDGRRKDVDYGFSDEEFRAAILKHAPALEAATTPRLVHWDAWDPNFFVKDGKITGLLDFERALWADPLMEAQFRPFFGEGVTHSMRGYGKTTFTFEEEQRSQLYTLHLALVMVTECFYRDYDTDFVYKFAKTMLNTTMAWLEAN
ncbi:MAG: aminoglycoside phosphotransferase family protein [Anaerolineae bacterium]|nr:aminoglycoside phosphotransferase family protein [Anaerolineae bacterium]